MRRLQTIVVLLTMALGPPCYAHHGGLGIEGDLVEWALKVDQWQAEVHDRDYRIKFLSYPRQPLRNSRTRLVFEIQSVLNGRYVSGLDAALLLEAPDGDIRKVPLPETTGVTAYYEAAVSFTEAGDYRITLQADLTGDKLQGTFHKTVRSSVLSGDWPIWLGHLTVVAAAAVTWAGLLLSIHRRFAHTLNGNFL